LPSPLVSSHHHLTSTLHHPTPPVPGTTAGPGPSTLAVASSHTTRFIFTRPSLRSLHATLALPAYPPSLCWRDGCDTTPHDSTRLTTAPLPTAAPNSAIPSLLSSCAALCATPSPPALVDLAVASRTRHLPTARRSALHAPIATSPRAGHPLPAARLRSTPAFLLERRVCSSRQRHQPDVLSLSKADRECFANSNA
jgi:hypothetical protein